MLVLQLHSWVSDQRHHSLVVDDDLAVARALDHLAGPLVHDLGGEVLRPARGAVQVAALKTYFFWMFKAIRAITGMTEYLSSWLWEEIDSRFHNLLLASVSSS